MSKQNISLSVDCAIFTRNNKEEKVLLIKRKNDPYKGQWALPGGFLKDMEPLEAGASREIKEETGLQLVKLHQIRAFGRPDRDPRGRTVSVAFYGLLPTEEEPAGQDDAKEAKWFPVKELPELHFDHQDMISEALGKIHEKE